LIIGFDFKVNNEVKIQQNNFIIQKIDELHGNPLSRCTPGIDPTDI